MQRRWASLAGCRLGALRILDGGESSIVVDLGLGASNGAVAVSMTWRHVLVRLVCGVTVQLLSTIVGTKLFQMGKLLPMGDPAEEKRSPPLAGLPHRFSVALSATERNCPA
ncbi:unnamed protein product [Ostreobium quekettii]|uniref:Uncharacterized protein n=1 Tax=Ostreobium quekettii TaxID=121088 RepID=A0A8S1ITP3_9CHLO|nr:unnamed protein product [Ostreobium quekettii]